MYVSPDQQMQGTHIAPAPASPRVTLPSCLFSARIFNACTLQSAFISRQRNPLLDAVPGWKLRVELAGPADVATSHKACQDPGHLIFVYAYMLHHDRVE